jgi:hypothetical protein
MKELQQQYNRTAMMMKDEEGDEEGEVCFKTEL